MNILQRLATSQAVKTYGHVFTPRQHDDLFEGTIDELRAIGYEGSVPTVPNLTQVAFPASGLSDRIRLRASGALLEWIHPLDDEQLKERIEWFNENDPPDEARTTVGWFTNKRRRLVIEALTEMSDLASASSSKLARRINNISDVALDALTVRDFDETKLDRVLGAMAATPRL